MSATTSPTEYTGQYRAARADAAKRATDYAASMLAEPNCDAFIAAVLTRTGSLIVGRGENQFRAILDACNNDSVLASSVAASSEGEWETIARDDITVLSRRTLINEHAMPIAWIFK